MITKEELKEKIRKAKKEGIEEGKTIERKALIDRGIIHVVCPICSNISLGFNKKDIMGESRLIKYYKCLNCGKEFKGLKNGKLKIK